MGSFELLKQKRKLFPLFVRKTEIYLFLAHTLREPTLEWSSKVLIGRDPDHKGRVFRAVLNGYQRRGGGRGPGPK